MTTVHGAANGAGSGRSGNGLGRLLCHIVCWTGLAAMSAGASAGPLDEMALDRWKNLRETERYQLNIAEKYYRENNYKIAAGEYEKFLTLYEKSEGASFAQLKWSLCQAHLKKLNTAIKDGYQSVIDYYPDSPDAIAAAYLMAKTYKDMGEVKAAKKAYANVLANHPDHLVAVYAKVDLIDYARIEKDNKRRVALWNELVYETNRKGGAGALCAEASRDLAQHHFYSGAFAEGLKALETTYNPTQLPNQVQNHVAGAISHLTGDSKTKAAGDKLADEAIKYIREKLPAELKDDQAKALTKTYMFYIADLQWAARRVEETRKIYEEILKTLGVEDDVLARLAGWLKSQNRRDEARGVYAKYRNEIEGQHQIAHSYREEKAYAKAIPIYQQLVQVDAKNSNQWQGTVAHCLREAGQYKEAIAAYRLWDSFPDTYWYMASCHRALKEYKEALGLYGQIMATDASRAPECLLQIGYTHEQAGEKEQAIKSLQFVCRKFPKSGQASQAHAHLQNVYKISTTLGGAKDE